MTIQKLKDIIDIVEVVGNYTELTGHGNRFRAKPNPIREGGDFDVYQDTQKFYDHGTGEGGDVVDFIEKVQDLNKIEALSFLQRRYIGGSTARATPVVRNKPIKKDNTLLHSKLETKAKKYLHASHPKYKSRWSSMTLDVEGVETKVVRVAPYLEKLFEGCLIPTDEKYAKYLFSEVIGYDNYFDCPVIIIRDEGERVVDIVRYRPYREGFEDLPKYLYTKNTEKPNSNYLFPLQAQMMKIMRDQDYCFVGEGLKNAINASLLGIPFISIEGAGNIKPELIDFLKSERMKNILMVGAFDGDSAGERAYKKINVQISMDNEFDFNSGIDFAEYLKELR